MSNIDSKSGKASPSKSSLFGLDGLNFLMADVWDGVGPFLSVFLKGGQHWSAGQIGIAMAASSIAAPVCQIPAGLLVDAMRAKRGLVAGSGLLVALGCLSIALFPNLFVVIGAQAMLGAASAIIPPALAALSLGLVGRKLFPAGRSHARNRPLQPRTGSRCTLNRFRGGDKQSYSRVRG